VFAYCRNEPVFRKDAYGTEDVCASNFENDNNLLNDLGKSPSAGSSGTSGHGATGTGYGGVGSRTSKIASTNSSYQFKNEASLNSHYQSHNREMGYKYHSPQEYLADANDVIKNGQYIPGKNAYVRFYNYWGGSNYQFVGMSFDHRYITTFHIKTGAKIFQ